MISVARIRRELGAKFSDLFDKLQNFYCKQLITFNRTKVELEKERKAKNSKVNSLNSFENAVPVLIPAELNYAKSFQKSSLEGGEVRVGQDRIEEIVSGQAAENFRE